MYKRSAQTRKLLITIALFVLFIPLFSYHAAQAKTTKTSWSLINSDATDTDGDGLSDWKEINLYHTNPNNPDTDGDGFSDGHEIMNGHDPNVPNDTQKLPEHIYISIEKQELRYYSGPYEIGDFQISSGIRGLDTPAGEYTVLKKLPIVDYKGADYDFPNTKWNLLFKPGKPGHNFYIHGAYWHHNFGHKMSHGCVNVAYADMQPLYAWADVGTPVTIFAGDFPNLIAQNITQ